MLSTATAMASKLGPVAKEDPMLSKMPNVLLTLTLLSELKKCDDGDEAGKVSKSRFQQYVSVLFHEGAAPQEGFGALLHRGWLVAAPQGGAPRSGGVADLFCTY